MNIEIRTDKNIHNSERLITYVRAELTQEFQRHSERITHFSVHFSDENGDKGWRQRYPLYDRSTSFWLKTSCSAP